MPTIDQLKDKTKKKFVRSDYRPWNYMDKIEQESNSNQLAINEVSAPAGNDSFSVDDSAEIDINCESISNHLVVEHLKEEKSKKILKAPKMEINKPETEIKAIHADHNIPQSTLDAIFRLSGHQKKIFLFAFDRCASRAMLSTGVINGETLTEITGTSGKMVKTSIQRLVDKSLINRERGKTGRGGFHIFSLTEQVRNAAIEYKRMIGNGNQLDIIKESNGNHKDIKWESPAGNKKNSLPDEWLKINIYPLDEIGFNHHHLLDIYETKLADPKMVQESILHYAYGLEYESERYKQYTDLLNVLIGRLRKGKPWFEKSYRSPQELAQVELLEAKKSALERKKKMEDDAFKLALAEWQENLGQPEVMKITEKSGVGDIMPASAKLSKYFRDTIWQDQKKNYLIMEE